MELASVFTDSMVLQRDMPIKIFGSGEGNVSVELDGERRSARSENGKWCVELGQRPAGGPYEMHIDLNGREITLTDIMMGDVWLAAGQSNVEMPLFKTENGLSEARHSKNDNIRLFTVPRRQKKDSTIWGGCFLIKKQEDTPWQRCSEESALNFSALGYYFARGLNRETNIPVGIIDCSWGGKRIEPFIDRRHCYECDALRDLISDYDEYLSTLDMQEYERAYERYVTETNEYFEKLKGDSIELVRRLGIRSAARRHCELPKEFPEVARGPYDQYSPGTLWDNMLSRLVPLQIKGMLWYQGESNGADTDYLEKYGAFLKCLRDNFGYSIPVYAVELAGFSMLGWESYDGICENRFVTENNWAFLREQQQKATEVFDNNYLVTSMELGDFRDIHPIEKAELAERLLKKALKYSYGCAIEADQPIYKSVRFENSRAYIALEHGEDLYCEAPNGVGIYIAGEDKALKRARIESISDNLICVYSPEVKTPVLVRYAFDNCYMGLQLYNRVGLPLAPFRTDR